MATDFFERQSSARRSTAWLALMFCLAVLGIVLSVFAITAVGLSQSRSAQLAVAGESAWEIPLLAAAATLLVIAGGTLFKVIGLRSGGGTGVAERLGGKRIYPDTAAPAYRQLLNIVEEMAIAAGTPVPPVFLLEKEQNINAFAAGYSPSDAVLGVTRGCCEQLTRDQLQGVIAHEFSHILNGDMRMSIRLIGILHGILLLGLAGQLIFRMLAYSGRGRSRRDSNAGSIMLAMLAIGLVLIVVGFIGTFFGNLIKAAVSRQREYLADASAVQFTRNPQGIAGALKRIGGSAHGARLQAPSAAEASHMYFAKGVWEGFSGLWATHPSLSKRILAIDPQWDGKFPEYERTATVSTGQASGFVGESSAGTTTARGPSELPIRVVDHMVHQVGEPTSDHRQYAAKLLAAIPQNILGAAREPYGARAVMYCLLLDRDADVRKHQFHVLAKFATRDVVQLTHELAPHFERLVVQARLPLVDLSLPALRAMSPSQFRSFSQCFDELVRADNRLALFEWVLSQVLVWNLRSQFEPVRSPRIQYYGLQRLGDPCSTLLSAIAYAGNEDALAKNAFDEGAAELPELSLKLKRRGECGLSHLRDGLAVLQRVATKQRGRLLSACAAAICADGHVSLQEGELLRGISDLLGCPMPPLLAGQGVGARPATSER
jgi:Zn-dependent protease with chaperone function